MATKENVVTVYGRLSFPKFTMAEAIEMNKTSDYPVAEGDVSPSFNLLLDQAQLDKLKKKIVDEFLPMCVTREAAKEKRNALTQQQADRILKVVNSDWEDQPPYIPIKPIGEKTAAMAPDAVAQLKLKGSKGVDVVLKAIVNSEDELVVPDPDILSFPVVRPLHTTVHSMYAGAYVAATINLYAFVSGKVPGMGAGADTAVFKADADRFGGGVSVDEDEIFAD